MQPTPQNSRIDVADLKFQIGKKVGHERAHLYFSNLRRFLCQKLSKTEFDKICLIALGKENIQLHNRLIRSILQNACHSKVPPKPSNEKFADGSTADAGNNSVLAEGGIYPSPSAASTSPIWSNGDIPSPRKNRTITRERKLKDMPSPLGPNGIIGRQFIVPSYNNAVRENGGFVPCDLKRPVLHDIPVLAEHPSKRQLVENPQQDQFAMHKGGLSDNVITRHREEGQSIQEMISNRGPLCAPLGIPFCSASVGASCRPLFSTGASSASFPSYCDNGELSNTDELRKRMEQIAASQGLGGVTMDAANLLNNALDTYLKRLIKSSVDMLGSRSRQVISHPCTKHQPSGKIVNGTVPENHINVQGRQAYLEGIQGNQCDREVSLLDFKVAMELNPQQLGEDWQLLLEKICLNSFKE